VRITAQVIDHHVVVRVRDEGVGMPAEMLARVFDPFFTTRAPGHGKGLGLPTALSIARSVGGNLELESTPGQGTTVVVTLVEADAAGHPLGAH
jgi:signal transduction histidine kinase